MSAYSKEVQNRENSSFKESKSLNSEDQKWTEAGFRKDSTGQWALKREEGWNMAIVVGLTFTPPMTALLYVSLFTKVLTIEERNDPKAMAVPEKWAFKLLFVLTVWFSGIMAVEVFLLKRSAWSRRLKKLQASKGQFDLIQHSKKTVRTICGLGPNEVGGLFLLINPAIMVISAVVVFYRFYPGDLSKYLGRWMVDKFLKQPNGTSIAENVDL